MYVAKASKRKENNGPLVGPPRSQTGLQSAKTGRYYWKDLTTVTTDRQDMAYAKPRLKVMFAPNGDV